MRKYTVDRETTLKAFTDVTDARASFALSALLREREVKVNGVRVSRDVPLNAGDEVCFYLTPAQEARKAFSVVYEDGNVAVIDKESGVNSEAVFAELARAGEIYFIHRLDRNTEGLMIFARTREAEGELLSCFRNRRAEKIYHALVVGRMPKSADTLVAYLTKDECAAKVSVSASPAGERIVTQYETIEEREGCSLLKITLHTGKTHQIRAHLAFVGHPVVGDEKYGDHAFNRAAHAARQRLLSKELVLFCGGALAYLNGRIFRSEKFL